MNNFKAIRLKRGLKLTEVARRAGVSKGYLSFLECGKRNPTIGVVNRLCSVLGATPNELIGPSEENIDQPEFGLFETDETESDRETPSGMTEAELRVCEDTRRHVNWVRNFVTAIVEQLLARATSHDASKFVEPEIGVYAEALPKLSAVEYGSDEYKAALKSLGPALFNHYAVNRHHPEHHMNGVRDMTLVDVVEMLCDWMAAARRRGPDNVKGSVAANASRFGLERQLESILINTEKMILETYIE